MQQTPSPLPSARVNATASFSDYRIDKKSKQNSHESHDKKAMPVNQATTKVMVLGAQWSFSGQDFVDLLLDESQHAVLGVSRSPERSALALRYKLRKDLSRYKYCQLDLNRDIPARSAGPA